MASLDLVALWEAHCRYEFETRDVDATMATMVSAPYVNHIPTMTGVSGTINSSAFTNIISSPSSNSKATNWFTSTSTGTRPLCSCRSDYSIQGASP
jgi:hypothetical protein